MLMHVQQEKDSPSSAKARYELIIVARQGCDLTLRVVDCRSECVLLDWHGAVVRHLLESGILPGESRRAGRYPCDKTFVWHLLLAGTVSQMALDQLGLAPADHRPIINKRQSIGQGARQHSSLHSLQNRLERLKVSLTGPHKWIARLLFAHPGQHFSAEDVRCLLLLECPLLVCNGVSSCLNDLARSCVIQRIEVNNENIFYDVNTSPHLHLFDPQTRELRDARAHGVVHVARGPIDARVQILDGSDVVLDSHANQTAE